MAGEVSWFYATAAASRSLVGLPALTPRVADSASTTCA